MSYECDDCGASFDTLSRLRLHDCTPDQPADVTNTREDSSSEEGPFEEPGLNRQELEHDYPEVVGDLPALYGDAREGDVSALYRAIAEYERVLSKVTRGDAPGGEELLHDLRFGYYEPLADGLDTAARTDGWDILVEFATAYDPREQNELPEVGHVIANAIGRSIIRTCLADSVDAIPADVLAFLGVIPEYVDEFHVAYEESYTYGWGIGHPEHSVSDRLRELAESEPKWGNIVLTTAFYADQQTAIDVFEEIVTDETFSGTIQRMTYDVDLTRYYFGAVADLERDFLRPHAPIYWEWEDEIDYSFDLDPDVKQRIRQLARETGVVEDLPADWTLSDLDPSPLSEFEDELFSGEE